jgi:hypothetical protein
VGGGLAAISPVVSLIHPAISAGVASAGMVLKGVGALKDAGKALLAHSNFNPHAIHLTGTLISAHDTYIPGLCPIP